MLDMIMVSSNRYKVVNTYFTFKTSTVHNTSLINTSKTLIMLATQTFMTEHVNIIIKITSTYAFLSFHIIHNSCHILLGMIWQLEKLRKVRAANIYKIYKYKPQRLGFRISQQWETTLMKEKNTINHSQD